MLKKKRVKREFKDEKFPLNEGMFKHCKKEKNK